MLPNPTVSSVTLKVDQVCDHVYANVYLMWAFHLCIFLLFKLGGTDVLFIDL